MTKNKKLSVIFIIVVVIVLIAVAVFFLVKGKKQALGPSSAEQTEESEDSAAGVASGTKEQVVESTEDALKAKLAIETRFFIERYGTYSSDGDYGNFRALKGQMTDDLFSRVIVNVDLKDRVDGFYSLETKVLNVELKEFGEDKIVFSASIQEKELESGETTISGKTAELTFIKDGNEWKADEINMF